MTVLGRMERKRGFRATHNLDDRTAFERAFAVALVKQFTQRVPHAPKVHELLLDLG